MVLSVAIVSASVIVVSIIFIMSLLLYKRMRGKRELVAAKLFLKRDETFKAIIAIAFSGVLFLSGRIISILASLNLMSEEIIYNVRYPLDLIAIFLVAYSYYKFYKILTSERYVFK